MEAVVLGDVADPDSDKLLTGLRRLAQLTAPGLDVIGPAAARLRAAAERSEEVAATLAGKSSRLADLLQAALDYRADHEAGTCPVCEQPLPAGWAERAAAEVSRAREAAAADREARADLARALSAAKALIRVRPAILAATDVMDLGSDAAEAWANWAEAPSAPRELADHLEERGLVLADAVQRLREAAAARLLALQDAWKPVAADLAAWLQGARAVEAAAPRVAALKEAEGWLKGVEGELQASRFAPIAERAQAVWNELRQQSSVDLTQIRLAGTATRRKVELDVTIDGREGVALGVMSQGELNALALSLFLPRMLLDESPFGFVVIDDPVQSMDPNKVDGLARVLGEAAQTRQVVVLTHDPRLAEALRRLRIEATVVRVARRGESVVEVTPWADPVRRHLEDARRLVHEEDKLGSALAGRVVPGLCRMAVEAACAEAVRRRRLAAGVAHEDVEAALADARSTHALVTLALFDDAGKHGQTYRTLRNQHADWAVDLLKVLNEGAHRGWTRELHLLVDRTRALAAGLVR